MKIYIISLLTVMLTFLILLIIDNYHGYEKIKNNIQHQIDSSYSKGYLDCSHDFIEAFILEKSNRDSILISINKRLKDFSEKNKSIQNESK